jgi:hypothetical protein
MSATTNISISKAEQARIYGRKSRGPVTPEGKRISSQNALQHGAYSHHAILLRNEDPQAFNLLHAALQAASKSSPALSLSLRQIDGIIRARRETLAALSLLRQNFPSLERTQDLPFLATNPPENEPGSEPINELPEAA